MKHHIIIKLRQELAAGLGIPDWHRFIVDKSAVHESTGTDVDRVLRDAGRAFWLAREYVPAAEDWNADERRLGLDRTYRLILQDDRDVGPGLVDALLRLPDVEAAHGIDVRETPLPPPQLATSASLPGPRPAEMIYAPYAQALTRGHEDVRVAVIDTGVDINHPELRGRVVQQADFVNLEGLDTTGFIGDFKGYDDQAQDEVGHGTHVSGIIGARGLRMDAGVAPACPLVAVRVLATMQRDGRRFGAGVVDNINTGIKYAVDRGRASVINMSLGIKREGQGLPHADIIRYALSQGVTIVAASGNDGTPEPYYPGALPGVCAVAAVGADGAVTSFSSYGAPITCVAPGVAVYSSFADHGYATASGTSQASPFVAASIALMKSYALDQGGRLGHADVHEILQRTSDRVSSRMRDQRAGYGLINLADGFKFLADLLEQPPRQEEEHARH